MCPRLKIWKNPDGPEGGKNLDKRRSPRDPVPSLPRRGRSPQPQLSPFPHCGLHPPHPHFSPLTGLAGSYILSGPPACWNTAAGGIQRGEVPTPDPTGRHQCSAKHCQYLSDFVLLREKKNKHRRNRGPTKILKTPAAIPLQGCVHARQPPFATPIAFFMALLACCRHLFSAAEVFAGLAGMSIVSSMSEDRCGCRMG